MALALVPSYLITNISASLNNIVVGNIELHQNETARISYRSDAVEAAVAQGLISIAKIGSDATVIQNLNDYIKSLENASPQVVQL